MITALKHDGGHVGTIDNPEDISEFVGTGCLIWVDVEGITAEDADRLIDEFDIEDLAQEDMRDGGRRTVGATAPRTKIENYEHHAFIAAYSGDLCPVNLLIGQDWVITFRQPNEAGQTWPVDTLLPRFETGDISTLGKLVWCVLDALIDDCLVTAGEIELRIETIEQSIFGSEPLERGATQRLQRQLFDIRRELVKLQHKVQPMEEVAAKLRDGDVMWVGTENAKEFENLRNHVLRATEQIAGHRELVSSEVDALLALASQRMNEVMKTMTGWGSILLGATLIAGIYGMNFTHMPELSWYFGYPSAILMMLLLTGDPLLLPQEARLALTPSRDSDLRSGWTRAPGPSSAAARASCAAANLRHDDPGRDREPDRDHADHRVDGLERAVAGLVVPDVPDAGDPDVDGPDRERSDDVGLRAGHRDTVR